MLFYIYLSLYCLFLIWFTILFLKYKISLYTSVYFIYTLLIAVPFFIIYAEIEKVFFISHLLHRAIDAKVTLSMGDGIKPINYLLVFNFIYLSIGTILMYKFQKVRIIDRKVPLICANKIYMYAKIIFIISIIYTILRYIFYPDFPLFALLQGNSSGPLRDIAFYYGSNTNIPYIFLPSINSQFYRILLPVSFFIMLFYYQNYKKNYTVLIFLIFSLFFVILLNLGTFKRTPILYLATWFILYKYMYTNSLKSLLRILKYIIITVGILICVTSFYTTADINRILLNLLTRFAVGEAIGEFLAIEHFGLTFDYLYFDIFTVYFQKVLGMDVMTFSELWKILVGGSRGYTSIGIIAEFIVSFGYFSIFYFVFFTYFILVIDIKFKKYSKTFYRPIIAGLITIISFMMVKGFFAQLFTGGVIVLFLILSGVKLINYRYKCSQLDK